MTTVRSLLAATALILASPAAAVLDLKRADVSHLPNGLTVILLEDHSLPVVSVQMLYKSGSAEEVRGKTGLAHFLEHLAFRGSANFPNAGATEAIYDSGGEWHGYTAMDQTTYFSTTPRDGLDLLLRIEADRMARVVIDPASIEAEKGAVVTELHSYENDPASVLQEAVVRAALSVHPYGSQMAGTIDDVERLNPDDAVGFYARHYAPGNAVLAIVGDFAAGDAKAQVKSAFANVAARPVSAPTTTVEPAHNGERKLTLSGPVDRPHFLIAFPAPAASHPDYPAFLLLQQLLAGSPGINAHQDGWAIAPAAPGSLLDGVASEAGSWFPATRDPFLFMIGGVAHAGQEEATVKAIDKRIAALADGPVDPSRLAEAKAVLARTLIDDVQTTEDAAHQLAFFEGIGALDMMLDLPRRIAGVAPADVRRVARLYLVATDRTVGWMLPGRDGRIATQAETAASAPAAAPAAPPVSGHKLPLFVQRSTLSDHTTALLLMTGSVQGGIGIDELAGVSALERSGDPARIATMLAELAEEARGARASGSAASTDPAERLEQLIAMQMGHDRSTTPRPLALVVAGSVAPARVAALADAALAALPVTALDRANRAPPAARPERIVERIDRPLAQGALGYVVEGPRAGTREALAWRILLYVLSHGYSGRLGRSAIGDQGLVYYIDSALRTDGARSWATLSIGVDPAKVDAMEAEMKRQIDGLVEHPPTLAEIDAAKRHLIGRSLSEAQSSDEIASRIARQFVETGRQVSTSELRNALSPIGPGEVAAAAHRFARGTIIRVDVKAPSRRMAARDDGADR